MRSTEVAPYRDLFVRVLGPCCVGVEWADGLANGVGRQNIEIIDDVCLFYVCSSCSVVFSAMFSYVPLCLVCVCALPYMVVLLDSGRCCTLVYQRTTRAFLTVVHYIICVHFMREW